MNNKYRILISLFLLLFSLSKISIAQLSPVNTGNIPAGDSIVITYRVTINTPVPAGTTHIANQGTVTGSNFSGLVTDDPKTATANDSTITLVEPSPSGPSIPGNLHATYTGRTIIILDWDNSTDNTGVDRYDVYKNNIFLQSTTNSEITVSSLTANTPYTFTVKAYDAENNSSGFSDPAAVTTKFNGLNYKYYHGTWTTLPDFNPLATVKTGNTLNVDISVRNRNDNFGFVWQGYINIPIAGLYTFETMSDDGSKLYFNNLYSNSNTATVNNDGIHHFKSATGTVNIPVAGLYPISITFFEKDGGENIQIFWTSPAFTRQQIPNNAFTDETPPIPDDTDPGTPTGLEVVTAGNTFVDLNWNNSTDNVGVTGYDVYRNGSLQYTTPISEVHADGLVPNTTYNFKVKARDQAGNTSDFSSEIPGTTTNTTTVTGLNYKYYEGTWNTLPDFNTLTHNQTGNTPNVNIGVRPAGRNDNFAFKWEGFINIPTNGNYTFETISDDGSRLYFNMPYSAGAIPTVNNDGLHYNKSVSTTVNNIAAGVYPITITYFEKDGGEIMQVYWSSNTGISRQLIPNSAFTNNPPPPPPPGNGLNYKYYEGTWNVLPDFNSLAPNQTGITPNVNIGVRPAARNDNFAFKWDGYINLPTTGNYTFETLSDDGSKLYFNMTYSAGATATVNNDGLHYNRSATGTVNGVAAGVYPITITYFEKDGGEIMEVYWTGPNFSRQKIPNSAFMTSPPPPINTFDLNRIGRSDLPDGVTGDTEIRKIYPNPFTERFNIDFYNSSGTNNIKVNIYDLKGRLIFTEHKGKLPAGKNILKINLGGRQLPWGIYMVGLNINGKESKMFRLAKAQNEAD